MANDAASHVLDNPAWHALRTDHANVAIGSGLARRYPADMVALAALMDASEAALNDLAQIIPSGETTVLISIINLPDELKGWTVHDRFAPVQMVCQQPVDEIASADTIVELTEADLPEILPIVELVHGVPFEQRTLELGHYVGIRHDGRLVSMAGERACLPGYHEISSVATHPDYWGRGYAGALVSHLVARNWQRGHASFLYVASNNTRAVRLYERLNFRKRTNMIGLIISRAGN